MIRLVSWVDPHWSMCQLRQPNREVDVSVRIVGEPALTTPLPVRTLIEPSRECEETVSWLCIRKTRRRAAPSPSLGRGASHPTEQYHQKDADQLPRGKRTQPSSRHRKPHTARRPDHGSATVFVLGARAQDSQRSLTQSSSANALKYSSMRSRNSTGTSSLAARNNSSLSPSTSRRSRYSNRFNSSITKLCRRAISSAD